MEEKAARAYDLAALKYWGPSTHINFPVRFFFFLILNSVPRRAVFKSCLSVGPCLILFNKNCPVGDSLRTTTRSLRT